MDESQNKCAEWKKPDTNEYIKCDSIYKRQNYSDEKQIKGSMKWGRLSGGFKGARGTFGLDRYVHYLNCDDFVNICQNSSTCILYINIWPVLVC